jgi:antitoxin HicB
MEAQSTKTLEYYLNLPYSAEIKHEEDGWFAKVVELPGCMTWADTFEELGPMIEDAKRGWIEDALEHGDPVPEPRSTEDFSGKVNLRMPKSLHRDLARRAQEEEVSLNQLMVATLARSVGARNTRKEIDPGAPGESEGIDSPGPSRESPGGWGDSAL